MRWEDKGDGVECAYLESVDSPVISVVHLSDGYHWYLQDEKLSDGKELTSVLAKWRAVRKLSRAFSVELGAASAKLIK